MNQASSTHSAAQTAGPCRRHWVAWLLAAAVAYGVLLAISLLFYSRERALISVVCSRITKGHKAVEAWAAIAGKHTNDPVMPPDAWRAEFKGITDSVAGEELEPPHRVGEPFAAVLTRRLLHFPPGTRIIAAETGYIIRKPGTGAELPEANAPRLPYNQKLALPCVPFAWMFVEGAGGKVQSSRP